MTDLATKSKRSVRSTGWFCLAWLATRLVMFITYSSKVRFIENDVIYYFSSLDKGSIREILIEYPVPVVWMVQAMQSLTGGNVGHGIAIFASAMVVLDAVITLLLWFRFSRGSATVWTVTLFALGSLCWFRLDLIVAAFVGLALFYLIRRPAASGGWLATAAAVKLWPALLIVPLAGRDKRSLRRLAGFAGVGLALGTASLLHAGWDRSASPITWQSDRGLQIESVAATLPMLRRAMGRLGDYKVSYSPYNAFEITGPGTAAGAQFVDIAFLVSVALTIVAAMAVVAKGRPSAATMVVASTAVICLLITTNKTFSPQYMIWLAGPFAALWTVAIPRSERRWRLGLVTLGIATCLLTQEVFPNRYGGLISNEVVDATATGFLVLRNLCMLALTVLFIIWTAIRVRHDLRPNRPETVARRAASDEG